MIAPAVSVRRRRDLALWFFLVPGMVYLVIGRILPALYTIYLSLTTWNLQEQASPVFAGVQNYVQLAADPAFVGSIGRTLGFMVVVTVVEVALGLALAVFVRGGARANDLLKTVVISPMVITPAVVGLIWYILFNDTLGPINAGLRLLGLPGVAWLTSTRLALVSVMLMDVWHWTPFTFLLSLSALETVPDALYEAAQLDGASRWRCFTRVTVPVILDTLLVAALLRAMEAFRLFAEPFVMTGGGPGNATDMLSVHIFKAAFQFFQMGSAAAMVVVSLGVLVLLYVLYLRLVEAE